MQLPEKEKEKQTNHYSFKSKAKAQQKEITQKRIQNKCWKIQKEVEKGELIGLK